MRFGRALLSRAPGIAVPLAVVTALVTAALARDGGGVGTGSALDTCGGTTVTESRLHVGERGYFAMGTLSSRTDRALTIRSVHVAELSPALQEVGVRSYRPAADGYSTTWAGGPDPADNTGYPPTMHPQSLVGLTLAAHRGLADNRYLLAEVVVRRPGTWTGSDLAVTYTIGDRSYRQTVGSCSFVVVDAKS